MSDPVIPQTGISAVYADNGALARDAATVDRTLQLQAYVGGSGTSAVQAGDSVQFYGNDQVIGGPITVTADDVARGYVSITTPTLTTGNWYFRAMASDPAGNTQTSFATWHVQEVDRAPPAITILTDDVGPQTGALAAHAFTNDATLTAHVSLANTAAHAGDTLVISAATTGASTTHALTAQDVANGYVDMGAPTLAMNAGGWDYFQTLSAKIQYADGTTGLSQSSSDFRLALNAPHAPTIDTATDDFGAQTGTLYPAWTTDDHTPTFNLTVDPEAAPAWTPPPPPTNGGSPGHPMPPPYVSATVGAPVELFANGQLVGQGTVTSDSHLSITTTNLASGTYHFTAVELDLAGNASGVSNSFDLTIADTGASAGGGAPAGGGSGGGTASASPMEVTGGSAGDSILGAAGADFIRGMDGNDTIDGGAGDDDVNGNKGEDIVHGGDGADFVRGGQGNDTVYGDAGDDVHVNGNLGNDLVYGGDGNDTVYGGQGDDTVHGDAGNDLVSGDLGNDILFGGAGADSFVMRAGFGVDWVEDFKASEGDRIELSPGMHYTVFTAGDGSAALDLGGGDVLVLAGVSASQFSADWVVYG